MSGPTQTAGKQRWICDDCGQGFIWNERSYWYGSLQAVDEGEWDKISVYCGCRPIPVTASGTSEQA